MIHKHASVRDLLRNPTENFPKEGEQTVVLRNGFPAYVVTPITSVNFMASSLGQTSNLEMKNEGEGVTIHEHKK